MALINLDKHQKEHGLLQLLQPQQTGANLAAELAGTVSVTPDGIGWDFASYPISPRVRIDGMPRSGSAGITPEALFNLHSPALTAPTNTYYVDVATGNDGNAGTVGSKKKTIANAITTGNATAAPYKIIVTAGLYTRLEMPNASIPTQDCALIATGGLVICSTCDQYATPSLDGTYTNCYAITMANVDRVLDLTRRDLATDQYVELRNVPTEALCNAQPGTWASVSGTVYVNRGDGVAVLNTNTRLLRQAYGLQTSTGINLFIGADAASAGSRWEFQGASNSGGQIRAYSPTPAATKKAFVVSNASLEYAGGLTSYTANAVTVYSWHGICALFDVSTTGPAKDGFNIHNYGGAPSTALLTVNCRVRKTGRPGSTSCNALTGHENAVMIDISGDYEETQGGSVHNIGASRCALIGTRVARDAGDLHYGGTTKPTAVRATDTAQIDCYHVTTSMSQGGGMHYHADGSSVITLKTGQQQGAIVAGNVVVE